jgi:hypothetical protein
MRHFDQESRHGAMPPRFMLNDSDSCLILMSVEAQMLREMKRFSCGAEGITPEPAAAGALLPS